MTVVSPIRVLVVDDSAFMRKAISAMLADDPRVAVIGTARNGEEALEKIPELRPDVVTLDVEMPGMNGLEALRHAGIVLVAQDVGGGHGRSVFLDTTDGRLTVKSLARGNVVL